jgi:putative sigma-54 modulation protein
MKIEIRSKNYNVAEKFRIILQKKVDRMSKYFDDDAICVINCTRIGKNEKIEIAITQKGKVFRGEVTSTNMYKNLDEALGKIERQIIKNKEKLRSVLRSQTIDEKAAAFVPKNVPIVQAEVMRNKAFSIEQMTEEEAELAMDMGDRSFFTYASKKDGKVCVMYRRLDGHIGIIEVTNSSTKQ